MVPLLTPSADLGKTQYIHPFNLCLFQWTGPALAQYYSPDDHAHRMTPGTSVVSISHLGIADSGATGEALAHVYGGLPQPHLTYENITKMFFGCDRKCYSFGEVGKTISYLLPLTNIAN